MKTISIPVDSRFAIEFKKAFYDTVRDYTNHWDRRSECSLILWFEGYKPQDCHDCEKDLMRFGARVTKMEFDSVCCKTYIIVLEPIGLNLIES